MTGVATMPTTQRNSPVNIAPRTQASCRSSAKPAREAGEEWRGDKQRRKRPGDEWAHSKAGLTIGGRNAEQLEHQWGEEVRDGGGNEGGGSGGGFAPPNRQNKPHSYEWGSYWAGGHEGGPFARWQPRDRPTSRCPRTRRVSRIRRSGGRETRRVGQSPPIPPLGGGGGKREAGGAVWDGLGRRWECPSPSRAVEEGGRGGVTNPASKRNGIGRIADAAAIDRVGDPSAPRRVDLSKGRFPESAPHRPRRRWGAAGNRPPPIFESGERPMAPTELGGGRSRSAEGTPLRRWGRLGDRKNPQSTGMGPMWGGPVWKFGSSDPNFQAAHRRKRRWAAKKGGKWRETSRGATLPESSLFNSRSNRPPGPMGDNRLPWVLNRGKRRCRPRRRAGKEGNSRRGVPSSG